MSVPAVEKISDTFRDEWSCLPAAGYDFSKGAKKGTTFDCVPKNQTVVVPSYYSGDRDSVTMQNSQASGVTPDRMRSLFPRRWARNAAAGAMAIAVACGIADLKMYGVLDDSRAQNRVTGLANPDLNPGIGGGPNSSTPLGLLPGGTGLHGTAPDPRAFRPAPSHAASSISPSSLPSFSSSLLPPSGSYGSAPSQAPSSGEITSPPDPQPSDPNAPPTMGPTTVEPSVSPSSNAEPYAPTTPTASSS